MKMTPVVVLVSFLLLLLTWLLLSGLNLNSTRRPVTKLRCAGTHDRRV
jgi:hypothetical protein